MRIKLFDKKVLEEFFIESFKKLEVSFELYNPVIEGLINTSLRGVDSHGVRLFPHYVKELLKGRINKNPKFKFEKKSDSIGILDADDSFGMTASVMAMEKAIELAKKSGIFAISVINSTHFGAAAIYSLMAAKNNMIGMCCTNTESLVVPYGGKKPYLGTNAFSFAAPCEGEEPFCLDMATSTVSLNKVRKYKDEGKELPKGWVVDEKGNTCTNPERENISLTPFGEYKGYGMAMMVEILAGALTGMNFSKEVTPMFSDFEKKRKLGHFFLVIDIGKFQDIEIFKKRLKCLMESLRNEPPKEGVDRIRVANDPEKEKFERRNKLGIPLSESELINFREIADLLKINKEILENYKNTEEVM